MVLGPPPGRAGAARREVPGKRPARTHSYAPHQPPRPTPREAAPRRRPAPATPRASALSTGRSHPARPQPVLTHSDPAPRTAPVAAAAQHPLRPRALPHECLRRGLAWSSALRPPKTQATRKPWSPLRESRPDLPAACGSGVLLGLGRRRRELVRFSGPALPHASGHRTRVRGQGPLARSHLTRPVVIHSPNHLPSHVLTTVRTLWPRGKGFSPETKPRVRDPAPGMNPAPRAATHGTPPKDDCLPRRRAQEPRRRRRSAPARPSPPIHRGPAPLPSLHHSSPCANPRHCLPSCAADPRTCRPGLSASLRPVPPVSPQPRRPVPALTPHSGPSAPTPKHPRPRPITPTPPRPTPRPPRTLPPASPSPFPPPPDPPPWRPPLGP